MTTENLIGKYLNRYLYSDVQPIGKIIGLKKNTKSKVIVQRVEASENKTQMEFVSGGFSAICTNQWAQEYDFSETEEVFEVRLSNGYLKNVRVEDIPVKFYDYNF